MLDVVRSLVVRSLFCSVFFVRCSLFGGLGSPFGAMWSVCVVLCSLLLFVVCKSAFGFSCLCVV